MKPQKTCLPTRVIDCQDPAEPRLVITANLEDVYVPYVALSYVWGKSDSHCTRVENYETYVEGIDHNIIPQTIRDAITVTNGLEMRYLWVDAFCIIQDSNEDKVKELVKMGSIYRDAYFTIVASSSPEGGAGFLHTRVLPPHHRLPFYCSNGALGSVCVGRRGDTVSATVPGKEPVDRRAWCFQEWLLSPRKLLYTTDTLRYHCQTVARPVEDSIREIRTVHSSILDHAFLPLPLAALANPDLEHLTTEELFTRQCMLWGTVVMNYTQRLLTRNTDRLLAFAAVAEQFNQIWQPQWHPGRYIAGLWERFLPRDLLWYRELSHHSWAADALRPRPSEYISPSWAWPSVDGQVITRAGTAYHPKSGVADICEVLECEVALLDKRLKYGQVTAGHLKLRTILTPAWIIVEPTAGAQIEDEYGDRFYYRLFAPTEELKQILNGSHMLGMNTAETVVRVGVVAPPTEGSGLETIITVDRRIVQDGRLLAVGRGPFKQEQTLLRRVGQCDIYFDSPERPDIEHSWLAVVNGGEAEGIIGEGLLVTSTADGKFRRVGYWSMNLEISAAAELDVVAWWRVDAEKTVFDLI